MQVGARQRASEAIFDNSRLVEFSEQIQYDAPAIQQTPLVQEGGRLVVTDQRLYFQPLHNVAGGSPVRSHPLAAVAAVAHRTSSLRPIGELTTCLPGFAVWCCMAFDTVSPGACCRNSSVFSDILAVTATLT